MNRNKHTKFKKDTVKSLLNGTSVAIYSLLYLLTTIFFYDSNAEYDYGVRGYIVLIALYLFLLITFLNMFRAFELGNKRISDLALSSAIALLFTNFIAYFVFGLIEGHLVLVWPYLGLLVIQCMLSTWFAYYGSRTVRFNFPPKKSIVNTRN